MANSDYTVRTQSNGFCPYAFIALATSELQTSVVINGYVSSIPNGIRIGMAAMIDDEIVSVLGQSGNTLTLGRGCCDTVPAAHAANSIIWFFDDSLGRDNVSYLGTETIGVKVLPRTVSGGAVPVPNAPPNGLTFNQRFVRPYPPGLLLINGQPFTSRLTLTDDVTPEFVLTWAHRNRVTQQDQLIDHSVSSITPEVGTTYRLYVYKADNTLVRTVTGLTGTTYTYTRAMCMSDFAVTRALHDGYIVVESLRDGFASYQRYRINFTLNAWTKVQADRDLSWMVKQYVQQDRSLSYSVLSSPFDPLFAQVALLLHFDLLPGQSYNTSGQVVKDYSVYDDTGAKTQTITAGTGKWGEASGIPNSSVAPTIYPTVLSNLGRFAPGAAMSLEFFAKVPRTAPTAPTTFGVTFDSGGGFSISNAGAGADQVVFTASAGDVTSTYTVTQTPDDYHAFLVTVENRNLFKFYVDGQLAFTYTEPDSGLYLDAAGGYVTFYGNNIIDAVRFTTNTLRQTGTYTPPSQPFPTS